MRPLRRPSIRRGIPPRGSPRRAVLPPAEDQPNDDQAGERRRLGERERVLNEFARPQTARVDDGECEDHHDGDELLRRETEGVAPAEEVHRLDDEIGGRDFVKKHAGEVGEGDGDGGDGPGLDDEEERPPERNPVAGP